MRAHSFKVESTIMQIHHQRIIFQAKGFFCINYETMLQVNGNSSVFLLLFIKQTSYSKQLFH